MSILLKPDTVMQCRGLQRRLTVDQARKMHEACSKMESEYWYLFTGMFPRIPATLRRITLVIFNFFMV